MMILISWISGKCTWRGTGMLVVEIVESAQHAYEKIQSTQYDTIVADYRIAGMEGIQF
jgi:CheY-like chemotaxis protein